MIADNDRFKPIFSNRRIGAAKEINTTANKKEQQKFETRILIVNAPFFMAANRFRRKNMKTFLKQVCSLILALLMVLSVVSVPTFSAKAEVGENPPSTMTLNEALNVEGGTIEFTNSGDYIDSENGNYIWRVEDDHIASPEIGRYEKKAIITAEVTANEGDMVSFDFICTVWDAIYVRDGLLFSIDNKELESGYGYGYVGCYDWTHKEYALTAGKHTLKWVFQLSTNATSGRAKLDNVYVGEPVHPSEIVLQDTAEVGVNCRVPLTYEVLPEEAFNKEVIFTSSDESIAVVLEDGNVVGMKTGTATITAATVDGGLVDTCEVTVIESEVGSAELFAYDGVYSREQSRWHTVLYKFSSGLPERAEVAAELSSEEVKDCNVVSCAYVNGKIYGYMTSGYREFRYIVIDEATQTVDYWGRTNMLHPQSMAYDYSTNTMYAIAYASQSNSKYAIYSVDIDTGDLTMIAELSENVTEIAVSRDGKIYGFLAHTINEIDKTTGEVTRLFYFQAPDGYSKIPWKAVCDFQTGLFYVLYESRTYSQGNINHNLYEINVDEHTARSCGYVTVNNKSGTRDMFIKNDIELPPREKTKFTVTFVDSMDGSVIGTAQYEVGTTLDETTFLTPPEHEGYAFTCWEYDENHDGEYLLYDITVTAYYHEEEAPATIIVNNCYEVGSRSYADWVTYTIAYTVNGAEYSVRTYEYGAAIITPAYDVPEGYTFSGWDVPETMPAEDLVVDATCTINVYEVTLIDGLNGDHIAVLYVAHGQDAVLPDAPEHAGYIFDRWDGDSTNVTENRTITACYWMIGDVNHDGEITTYDALLIMRYALGLETEGNERIMDFNGDGCVDSLDALLVLRRSIGAA